MKQDSGLKLFSHPMARWVLLAVSAPVALLVLIQLLPVWLFQSNPAAGTEPAWDSPATRALAVRACFDCHSNETVWPWYSKVAPISWLITRDVFAGRRHLNFSEWSVAAASRLEDDPGEQVTSGEMPPAYYVIMHPDAELTPAERQQLAAGLQQTMAGP